MFCIAMDRTRMRDSFSKVSPSCLFIGATKTVPLAFIIYRHRCVHVGIYIELACPDVLKEVLARGVKGWRIVLYIYTQATVSSYSFK